MHSRLGREAGAILALSLLASASCLRDKNAARGGNSSARQADPIAAYTIGYIAGDGVSDLQRDEVLAGKIEEALIDVLARRVPAAFFFEHREELLSIRGIEAKLKEGGPRGGATADPASSRAGLAVNYGRALAVPLMNFELTSPELERFRTGRRDALHAASPAVDLQEGRRRAQERVAALRRGREQRSAQMMAVLARAPGVLALANHVLVRKGRSSHGPSPSSVSIVKVSYRARMMADAWESEPISEKVETELALPEPHLASCLRIAMPTLRVGERASIACGPSRAYGKLGLPPIVLDGDGVVFDVELLGIAKERWVPPRSAWASQLGVPPPPPARSQ